jgi:hypothetical protein
MLTGYGRADMLFCRGGIFNLLNYVIIMPYRVDPSLLLKMIVPIDQSRRKM